MGDWLKDKVAIVTGSSQGIGKAIAISFAQEGAKVVTNNRRAGTEGGDAETVAKEIADMGGQAIPFFGSVSDFAVAEKMVKAAIDKFGRVDILVNNGGADSPKMVWNMTEEDWDKCVDSFLKGAFNCTRHVAGLMRDQKWGRIINTTSTAFTGTVGHCNYGAAKAGLVGLTRAVARELGRSGVTCNAYCPTAATRFTLAPDVVAGFKKRYEAGLITKQALDTLLNLPSPETVAPFLVYLCTNAASNINGQVFYVYGNSIGIYAEPVPKLTVTTKSQGMSQVKELIDIVPQGLLKDYKNPAPPGK